MKRNDFFETTNFKTATDVEFETAVTHALEQKPPVVVPVDFAAKVKASLPAQVPARSRVRQAKSVSRMAGAVAAAVLVLAMCLLAPHSTPSYTSVAFDMELLLLAELCGLAALMSMRHDA